jgi:hypothetical protein
VTSEFTSFVKSDTIQEMVENQIACFERKIMHQTFTKLFGLFFLSIFLAACTSTPTPTPNKVPTITSVTANPISLAPGASSTITVVASDGDNDSLTYTYSATNGTVSGTGATATFLAGSVPGTANITVTVNDGRGGTANSSTNLTIVLGDPIIQISAQVVKDDQNIDCLLFYAKPQEDLIFNSVKTSNPLINLPTYNLGGTLVIKNEIIALQDEFSCYTKLSGDYTFVFTGSRPGGAAFTATTIYNQP